MLDPPESESRERAAVRPGGCLCAAGRHGGHGSSGFHGGGESRTATAPAPATTTTTTTTTKDEGHSTGSMVATGLLAFGAGLLVGEMFDDDDLLQPRLLRQHVARSDAVLPAVSVSPGVWRRLLPRQFLQPTEQLRSRRQHDHHQPEQQLLQPLQVAGPGPAKPQLTQEPDLRGASQPARAEPAQCQGRAGSGASRAFHLRSPERQGRLHGQ